MRYWLLALLLVASTCLAQTSEQEVFRADGNGQVLIGPDGSVLEVQFDQSFGKELDAVLKERVQAWKFVPIVEAGKPVKARAHFRLNLQAEFGGKSRGELRITHAEFVDPPGSASSLAARAVAMPRYPRDAIVSGVGAEFVMLVKFDETGKVVATSGQDGWINIYGRLPGAKRQAKLLDSIVASCDAAVRQWSFADLAEKGERYAQIPFGFSVSKGKGSSPWRRSYRRSIAKADWTVEMGAARVSVVNSDGTATRGDVQLLSKLDPEALPES